MAAVATVAEMTTDDLKALIVETVQEALAQVIGESDWAADWRELLAHQRHLASLYAEFAEEDLALAETGVSEYAAALSGEDRL